MGQQPQSKKEQSEFILTQNEIIEIINSSFGKIVNSHYMDSKYIALSEVEMLALLYKDKTNLNTYIENFYDCDDYSFDLLKAFQKYAFGVAFIMKEDGSRHCVNVQIDPIKKVARLIEPQSDGQYTDYKFVYFILI